MTIQTDLSSKMTLTEERAAMYAKQLEILVQQQPRVANLRDILLAIGGVEIIIPFSHRPEIPLLIDVGFLMTGAVKHLYMGRRGCDEYVAKLWLEKKVGLTGIGRGLALQENGLWVWHKWGLTGDTIIETRRGIPWDIPLLGYFGRVLEAEEADRFARVNTRRLRSRLGKRSSTR